MPPHTPLRSGNQWCRTSKRDSGTPKEPLLICVLKAVRPAWPPMSRTHSCSNATASTFTPYLHTRPSFRMHRLQQVPAPNNRNQRANDTNSLDHDSEFQSIKANTERQHRWALKMHAAFT